MSLVPMSLVAGANVAGDNIAGAAAGAGADGAGADGAANVAVLLGSAPSKIASKKICSLSLSKPL